MSLPEGMANITAVSSTSKDIQVTSRIRKGLRTIFNLEGLPCWDSVQARLDVRVNLEVFFFYASMVIQIGKHGRQAVEVLSPILRRYEAVYG